MLCAGISCCTYARLNKICTLNGCRVVACYSQRPPMNGIFTFLLFTYDVLQTQANFFLISNLFIAFFAAHISVPVSAHFFLISSSSISVERPKYGGKKREKIVRRSAYRPVSWLMTHGIQSVSKCYVAFSSILSLHCRHPSAQLHHYYGFNYFVNCGVKKWANVRAILYRAHSQLHRAIEYAFSFTHLVNCSR